MVSSGGGSGTGGGGGGLPACFTGNVRIKVAGGWHRRFDKLPYGVPFWIENKTGVHRAELLTHDYDGEMLDMGDGELVTPGHKMKSGKDWIPACDRFPNALRVKFKGTVYNLHVISERAEDHHYILENGEVAHNLKYV